MDEFNIDICLTGHDHTFSRSYQILDGNVVDYDISSGSVTNPLEKSIVENDGRHALVLSAM